jgi:hypothetical protein
MTEQKIVSQKCIGYQKNNDNTTNSVFEEVLENEARQWSIAKCNPDKTTITLMPATRIKPRIDIPR